MHGQARRMRRPLGTGVAAALAGAVIGALAGTAAQGADSRAANRTLAGTGRIEVNAMEYPWSAIGRLNAGGRGHCTGVLIGERRVLTAAHCLYDGRSGRWRAPSEVHFVAGYQRDTFLIHSPVRGYERSKRFRVDAGAAPGNAVADWALLTLEAPIGRQAGWLGLRRLDRGLLARLERGGARLLQAGYRRGWTHIMTLNLGCAVAGFFEGRAGIVHSCAIAKGDSGSPLLVLADGEFRVAGLHVINAHTRSGDVAGALSVALFHPQGGTGQAVEALRRAGAVWSGGGRPMRGSPASAVPLHTIDQLLARLGHLKGAARAPSAQEREAAIAAFQSRAGLPVTGRASLALLARLIRASR